MKQYRYKALTPDGQVVTGTLAARTAAEARGQLRGDGMRIIEVKGGRSSAGRRFSRRRLSLLAREWSALLEAGLPMMEALSLMAAHRGRRERTVISEASRVIQTGQPLREALAQSGAFPPFFLALVAVGEMSGTLPRELQHLSQYYQKEADLRRRLLGAAAYPLFICLFIAALFTVILTFILPSFALLFETLALPVPPITAAALSAGLWLRTHGVTVLLEILTACLMLTLYFSSAQGRRHRDALLFCSHFVRRLFLIRLCHTLAALLGSGRPLSEALEDAAPLSGNLAGARRIRRVHEELIQGGHFPDALARAGLTTPVLYTLAAAGMETGQLPEFLENAAQLMTDEMERRLTLFQSILAPALLCLAGALVAAVLFAVMMPILSAIGKGIG